MIVEGYTIDLKNVDRDIFSDLIRLSAYGNVCILAMDININDVNQLVKELEDAGCRHPYITDRIIGRYIESKEDLKCILSSI